jgi:predicted RNase H-like nuclease (RuvC/YqgF family)
MAMMFFFRPGMSDLEREVHNLRSEVRELKDAIDAQSAEIKTLHEKADKENGRGYPKLTPP